MTAIVNKHTRITNADNFLESFSRQSPDYVYMGLAKNDIWNHYQRIEDSVGTAFDIDIDAVVGDSITVVKNGNLLVNVTDYQINFDTDVITFTVALISTDVIEMYIESDTVSKTPKDDEETVTNLWSDLIAAKRITSNNVVACIKRYNWETNKVYHEYNDRLTTVAPLVNGVQAPMYVMNSSGNVYKCIETPRDNQGEMVVSTTEPTSVGNSIFSTADGYRWKFMYSVSIFNTLNFMTDEYIPVKSLVKDDGSAQWLVQQSTIDGGIHHFEVLSSGDFVSDGSYPIVVVSSTGTGFSGTVTATGGVITAITIADAGTGYRDATASVTGAGISNVALRPIISPIGGHGANAKEELEGIYVMVKCIFDSSEGGVLASTLGDDFRQVCLISNPKSVSATGSEFILTGYGQVTFTGTVVRATSNDGSANVVTWDYLTGRMYVSDVQPNATGTFVAGTAIRMSVSQPNTTEATIESVVNGVNLPATEQVYLGNSLVYGSGKVIYIENRLKLQRNQDQSEDIRLVIEF